MTVIRGRKIKYILFDLDETLYPKGSELMRLVNRRISEYMCQHLGIEACRVDGLREEYYAKYGTTSQGLYFHHQVDLEKYLAFVHDVPVEKYLSRNEELDKLLARLPVEKDIFTNSPNYHVTRVLRALGLERHFSRIFDVYFLDHTLKPDPRAYGKVLGALGAKGEECLLVDDVARNLRPGRDLGMLTVLVWNETVVEGVDFAIPRITDLEKMIDSE